MTTHADHDAPEQLDSKTRNFYLNAMDALERGRVPYLVGGAYSLAHHAGVVRHTKDFDVFVKKADARRALKALDDAGYRTEITFPHWLGKAYQHDAFVDVIFGSGNGLCAVDDEWFAHAVEGEAIGRRVKLCPAEEIIWTKAFVQERERFDGADIAHIILSRGPELDWQRLLRRFESHERVLLAHLVLFGYIYPSQRECVPEWVMTRLLSRVQAEPAIKENLCRGTFLSREQYLMALCERGFEDPRLQPRGPMNKEDIAHWTAAINTIK